MPTIGVKRIELDVENLTADINLNANVASLVTVNAGVALSITKVNLTISDVGAELELIVRLGHLVDIVNRVFKSLDLNPLIIGVLNNVTSVVTGAIGAVDGLLGSITQGESVLNFLIDNLGNIVQELVQSGGGTTSQIVGNYQNNMTYTGKSQALQNGQVQRTYSYGPLNALVNIIFNSDGQIVQASVVKPDKGGQAPATSAQLPMGSNAPKGGPGPAPIPTNSSQAPRAGKAPAGGGQVPVNAPQAPTPNGAGQAQVSGTAAPALSKAP